MGLILQAKTEDLSPMTLCSMLSASCVDYSNRSAALYLSVHLSESVTHIVHKCILMLILFILILCLMVDVWTGFFALVFILTHSMQPRPS